MTTSPRHRRPRSIRRAGRHAKPSQLHTAADTAYKAAPAMAIAGTLIVGSHGSVTARAPVQAAAVAEAQVAVVAQQAYTDALVIHHEQARRYTVRAGDSLSSIAQRYYGSAADWPTLYTANKSVIANPNRILPGQVLTIPSSASARSTTTGSQARSSVLTTSSALSGTLSCRGLEELWEQAGGPASRAVLAASIAMAESGGRQFATGAAGERGYWQIHPVHGSLSTYNALGNAKAAVAISGDGTDWTPWTTFTSGAYRGRC
jgi:LysM repeat protein